MHISVIYPAVEFGLYSDFDELINTFDSYWTADLAMHVLDAIADCTADPHDPPHPGEPVPENVGDTA